MIEVVCECRRFGDRTNENTRDWLWVVLVVRAAKSISLFAGQDLGSDSTFLPHGRNHGDLQATQHVQVNHLKADTRAAPPCPHHPLKLGTGRPGGGSLLVDSNDRASSQGKRFRLTMNSSPASNFASISLPTSFSGTRRSSLMSPLSLIKDM